MPEKEETPSPVNKRSPKKPLKAAMTERRSKDGSPCVVPSKMALGECAEATPQTTFETATETLCPGMVQQESTRLQLTQMQKEWIVIALARYVSPSDLVKEMKSMFGVDVSRQLLQCYDPNTRAGMHLRAELKDLFYATRRAYLASIRQIGTADQNVRLAELDQIFHKYKAAGNLQAARDTLKQIAEEVGGKYTNTQNVNVTKTARENLAAVLGVPVDKLPPGRSLNYEHPSSEKKQKEH